MVNISHAGDFLVKLQTIKSTGDAKAGSELFDKYSKVDGPWATWRDIVLKHKRPRNIFVQANTVANGLEFLFINYSILLHHQHTSLLALAFRLS